MTGNALRVSFTLFVECNQKLLSFQRQKMAQQNKSMLWERTIFVHECGKRIARTTTIWERSYFSNAHCTDPMKQIIQDPGSLRYVGGSDPLSNRVASLSAMDLLFPFPAPSWLHRFPVCGGDFAFSKNILVNIATSLLTLIQPSTDDVTQGKAL